MIPNTTDTVAVQSTMADGKKFGVHAESLGKIMQILTNLYSDPEQAVAREYLTNAYDAQVAAGMVPGENWRPIEVTTPSNWNPTYTIRDYGVGLDETDLDEIYSQYGMSTKEDSNDFVGTLGLGSKSALTYTQAFTVTGYKNGVMTRALISIDEDGVPEYTIDTVEDTDEPNGTSVSIPVASRSSFDEKTRNVLRWWPVGLVKVNGKDTVSHNYAETTPVNITVDGEVVESKVFLSTGSSWNRPRSYVVMGNVGYEVDDDYIPQGVRSAGIGFVAYVPIGAVSFPPSREQLFYNARTKATLSQITDVLIDRMAEDFKTRLEASGKLTAFRMLSNIPDSIQNHPDIVGIKYKGQDFSVWHDPTTEMHFVSWNYSGKSKSDKVTRIYIDNALSNNVTFVTGFGSNPSASLRSKLKKYLEDNSLMLKAYFVEEDIDCFWLSDLHRVDVETIRAIRHTAPAVPKTEPTYDCYRIVNGQFTATEERQIAVKKGERIVYVSPAEYKETRKRAGTTPNNIMHFLGDDAILVVLGTNRWEKFKRYYPNAVHLKQEYARIFKELLDSVKEEEHIVASMNYAERSFFKNVVLNDILDPELRKIGGIVVGNTQGSQWDEAKKLSTHAHRAQINLVMPDRPEVATNAMKNYPLIARCGDHHADHVLVYVNALWRINNPEPLTTES